MCLGQYPLICAHSSTLQRAEVDSGSLRLSSLMAYRCSFGSARVSDSGKSSTTLHSTLQLSALCKETSHTSLLNKTCAKAPPCLKKTLRSPTSCLHDLCCCWSCCNSMFLMEPEVQKPAMIDPFGITNISMWLPDDWPQSYCRNTTHNLFQTYIVFFLFSSSTTLAVHV